ncbi:polyadenylate-binding protein [Enteropsectra breve]|nr:polyadenylate-binding protein [Enteropsectra breve]
MDNSSIIGDAQLSVHCGNLAPRTSSLELHDLFAKVAPVTKISMTQRKDSSMASISAFAYFKTKEDCEKIISELNHFELNGKQMTLTLYNPSKKFVPDANIVVKNLPLNLNSRDLNEIFKMFGQIESCKVASNEKGELKGYGFVQYKNAKSAKRAVSSCKNVKIGNNIIEVEFYNENRTKTKEAAIAKPVYFTNCYVKNFPSSFTEQELREMFAKYGEITSLFFPVKADKSALGYACVNYSKQEEAQKAIDALNNTPFTYSVDGEEKTATLFVVKAEDKKFREESMQKQMEGLTVSSLNNKKNLYISNIPLSFSDNEILEIFDKFGTIADYKISANVSNSYKYGYICYSGPYEACMAFEKIDGTVLDGERLQISYYKNKNERAVMHELKQVSSENKSNKSELKDGARKRNDVQGNPSYEALYECVCRSCDDFSAEWKKIGALNGEHFSKKMTKALIQSYPDKIQLMVEDKEVLSHYISLILCNGKITTIKKSL